MLLMYVIRSTHVRGGFEADANGRVTLRGSFNRVVTFQKEIQILISVSYRFLIDSFGNSE